MVVFDGRHFRLAPLFNIRVVAVVIIFFIPCLIFLTFTPGDSEDWYDLRMQVFFFFFFGGGAKRNTWKREGKKKGVSGVFFFLFLYILVNIPFSV